MPEVGVKRIKWHGKERAIVVRNSFIGTGYNFFSKKEYPLQFGVNFYKKGDVAKPHIHLKRHIVVENVQEIFRIESGKVTAEIYDDDGKRVYSVNLNAGDIIFFIEGGHGFRMLEDTKILEVKGAPYIDKEHDKMLL